MLTEITFAEQLRILIDSDPARRNTSANQLAEAMGITAQTLLNLINGKSEYPRLSTVRAICELFNIPLNYFMCTSADECRSYLRRHGQFSGTIRAIHESMQTLSPKSQYNVATIVELLQRSHLDS